MSDFINNINDPVTPSYPNIQNVAIVSSAIELTFQIDPTATMPVSGKTFIDGTQKSQLVGGTGNAAVIQKANASGHSGNDNVVLVQMIDPNGNVYFDPSGTTQVNGIIGVSGGTIVVSGGSLTDGTQKTSITNSLNVSGGTIVVSGGSLTDGTQKTKIIDNNGNVQLTSGMPSKLITSFVRPNNTTNYTTNYGINTATTGSTCFILTGASISNGGGGFINDVIIETDVVQFAGATVRFWLYNAIPSSIANDNGIFVMDFTNKNIRIGSGYFDVIFDAQLAGSSSILGHTQPLYEYVCATNNSSIYFMLQTLSSITAPNANGNFNISMNVLKLS